MKKNEKIDFVVLWVDPSDLNWQESRRKYRSKMDDYDYVDDSEER